MAKAATSRRTPSTMALRGWVWGTGFFFCFVYGKRLVYLHFVCTICHAEKSVLLFGIVVAFAQGRGLGFKSMGEWFLEFFFFLKTHIY